MPEPFDAVLLDLYDTIVWSEWSKLRGLITARYDVDDAALQSAFESTRPARGVGSFPDAAGDMEAVIRAAGLAPDPGLVRDLVQDEREMLLDSVHLYDDVVDTVRGLRARGVKTALVSNCSHSTRPVVDRLGLEELFDRVVLSFEVRTMKPEAEIYRLTLGRLGGVDASRAVFVDDQTAYCDGASAVGMASRLILRANEVAPIDTHGHVVVTDLSFLG